MEFSHPPAPNPLHPEDGAQGGAQRHAGRQGAAGGARADGRGGHEGLRAQQWDIIYGPINGYWFFGNIYTTPMEIPIFDGKNHEKPWFPDVLQPIQWFTLW